MPQHRVPVQWTMTGYVVVDTPEGASQDAIVDAAHLQPLPDDGEYLDDSFAVVDPDGIESL